MSDNKLPAKQVHGPTHRFVFERSGPEDPQSIGLIRSTYARDGTGVGPTAHRCSGSPQRTVRAQ